jgi:hypothetical protein
VCTLYAASESCDYSLKTRAHWHCLGALPLLTHTDNASTSLWIMAVELCPAPRVQKGWVPCLIHQTSTPNIPPKNERVLYSLHLSIDSITPRLHISLLNSSFAASIFIPRYYYLPSRNVRLPASALHPLAQQLDVRTVSVHPTHLACRRDLFFSDHA